MSRQLVVGRIVSAHGIRGECAVEVLSDAPERFDNGSVLDSDNQLYPVLTIVSSRPHKTRLLVTFDRITDRNAAEALRGTLLSINAHQGLELREGAFYPHQIEGCEVFNEDGTKLGVLSSVLENPAHDIWVVQTPDGQDAMVPAVKEFVRDVDLDSKRIVLSPIEGMF